LLQRNLPSRTYHSHCAKDQSGLSLVPQERKKKVYIIAIGVSYRKTPIEVREKLAFDSSQLPSLFGGLKAAGKIAGCVILSTCNRMEIYAASRNVDAALAEIWSVLAAESGIEVEELQEYLYSFTCEQAIEHLFRVASGLDSMILGEMEILGQVARAYQFACENSACNSVLNVLFQRALKVGKQVRNQTRIGTGASSVGAAAVELARKTFGDIQGRSILLIGAGEVGRLVARNIANNGASQVMVCNRSYDKAQELASEFGGSAVPFETLTKCMARADLILSCTAAPDYIISREQLAAVMSTRNGKPLFLIDLAVPRDIEPESSQLQCVRLCNVDDLQSMVNESMSEREAEARKAETIIEKALDNFRTWLNSRHAVPVIQALYKKGEEIRDSELEKAMRKLGTLTEREENVIRSMANSIANRLMNTPIVQLRQYAQTEQGQLYVQFVQDLFDLPARPVD
jgi:glutamyl-tRNA reductase